VPALPRHRGSRLLLAIVRELSARCRGRARTHGERRPEISSTGLHIGLARGSALCQHAASRIIPQLEETVGCLMRSDLSFLGGRPAAHRLPRWTSWDRSRCIGEWGGSSSWRRRGRRRGSRRPAPSTRQERRSLQPDVDYILPRSPFIPLLLLAWDLLFSLSQHARRAIGSRGCTNEVVAGVERGYSIP
jgi:hypothetical protein